MASESSIALRSSNTFGPLEQCNHLERDTLSSSTLVNHATWPRPATALSSVVSPAALAIIGAAYIAQPEQAASKTILYVAITGAQTALFIYEVCFVFKLRHHVLRIDKLATTVLIVGLLTTYLVTGLSCVSYLGHNDKSAVVARVILSGL